MATALSKADAEQARTKEALDDLMQYLQSLPPLPNRSELLQRLERRTDLIRAGLTADRALAMRT